MSLRDARNMNPEELGHVLEAKRMLIRWLETVEDEAVRQLSVRTKIPGFKLVGSKPHRRWDNDEQIVKSLAKYPSLFEELCPRKPLTPARVTSRLSRKRDGNPKLLEKLSKHITHNPIEPRVASEDDPRPLFNAAEEFDD